MIKEFLRMSHISTSERLKDMNLTIYEGEIVFLLSNHWGELEEIWQIIAGYKKRTGGALFLEEQPVQEYNKEFCAAHGIFHIDVSAQLVENLSIAENLFVVKEQKRGRIFAPYNRKAVALETKDVLRKVGLILEPEVKVWQLESFERFQVCLAKAIVSGANLILIDDVENKYNSVEKKRMMKLLQDMRQEGIASLILADRPGELLDVALKIVLVKNGRDMKMYFSQDKMYFSQDILYRTITKAWLGISEHKELSEDTVTKEEALLTFVGDGFHRPLERGKIYGFYDGFWDMEKKLKDYLMDFEEKNHAGFYLNQEENCYTIEELMETGQIVYIPKESAFLLLENMSIGRNITIPNRERAVNILGIPENRLDNYMEEEFCRRVGLEPGTPVWNLDCKDKKILSIYRWLFQKPLLLILEEPTYRLNLQEADGVREYLKGLASQGLTLLVSEGSFYEEELICDTIIHTRKSRYRGEIDRDEFPKIKAEWLT